MPSYDNKVLTGDQLVYFSGLIKTALAAKADSSALTGKQDALTIGGSGVSYNASTNPVATLGDIEQGVADYLVDSPLNAAEIVYDDTDENHIIWLANKIAEIDNGYTSLRDNKQEVLVFNTAYNASSNKVATMADIPTSIDDFVWGYDEEEPTPIGDTLGYFTEIIEGIIADDGESVAGSAVKVDEDAQTGDAIMLDTVLSNLSSGKQDALVFNTAYNASSNKVATMSDITSALGGISSFSFEIVNSLPQSDISTSKIYLVAKQTSGTNQVYTEYAYVNNAWEIIGDTSMTIDTLSNQEVQTIWNTASAT